MIEDHEIFAHRMINYITNITRPHDHDQKHYMLEIQKKFAMSITPYSDMLCQQILPELVLLIMLVNM